MEDVLLILTYTDKYGKKTTRLPEISPTLPLLLVNSVKCRRKRLIVPTNILYDSI